MSRVLSWFAPGAPVHDAATQYTKDEYDLAYYGKKQSLRRNFTLVSILGLTCGLMITWEGVLITFQEGFANGGPEGLVAGFLFAWVGVLSQTLCMAEMGSMIPVAGGQYNWVAILAPKSWSRFLSYMTGWITTIGWQAVNISGTYLAGSMIQGIVVLNHASYTPANWQTTLIIYAVMLVAVFVNTALARILPHFETAVLVIHILGFVALLVALLVLGPHESNADVFQTWLNEGDWESRGLTFLIGVTTSMFSFLGVDGAAHMAEEIENAATVIPQAMVGAAVINGALGFAMLLAVLYRLGDINAALSTPTGYPYMEIVSAATGSTSGGTGIAVVIVSIMFFASISILAGASRMLWAFAREKAVPGHSWVSRVHQRTALPLPSILVCATVNILLALIEIGSTAAFNAFTSLTVAAFYSSYTVAACTMLYRRLTHTTDGLRWGPFRLGRAGTPLLIFSIAYSVLAFFFSFWPQNRQVTPQNMNWSVVVYCGVVIFALLYWFAVAKRAYTGPVQEITIEDLTGEKRPDSSEDGRVGKEEVASEQREVFA